MTPELIQYVDEHGNPTGETEEKLAAHHAQTRRHLAFSCYIFDDTGRLLVTQRAASKKVWPSVWTNSVCGHPAPGETFEDAIRRRAVFELGITQLDDIRCVLPDFSYITPPMNGIIENEFCPVLTAQFDGKLSANPEEVSAARLMTIADVQSWIAQEPSIFSYWSKLQIPLILRHLPT